MEATPLLSRQPPSHVAGARTYLLVAWVLIGLSLSNALFYVALGDSPPAALARPAWTAVALGALALAIAWKEHGAARAAFLMWAAHQALIVLTPLGASGWGAWLSRATLRLVIAAALIMSATPVSHRDRRLCVVVVVATIALSWAIMGVGRQALR